MKTRTHMKWVFDADEWSWTIREANDLVFGDLADILGMSDDLIRSWEMMRSRHHFYRWPSAEQVAKVCSVLDIDPRRFWVTRYEP